MLGYSNLLIALLSDVPPYALNWVATRWWTAGAGEGPDGKGVSQGYWAVHFFLQACLTGCCAFPIFLWRSRRVAVRMHLWQQQQQQVAATSVS